MLDPSTPEARHPAGSIGLEYDPFGRRVLTNAVGERQAGVVPVRGFPFSAPAACISFCDQNGREVFFLPDLEQLDRPTRDLVEADLSRREFIPVIRSIYSVSSGAEPTDWHVLTDRGDARFVLNSPDNVRRMGPRAALIADSHGVRFRIEDTRTLDAHSRRLLRRYL